jgi:outer membrane protein assembly factor BamB
LVAGAAGQEWGRFRGPNGSGVSETGSLPDHWTEKDFRWKIKLPGVGHSSPVVSGERVFVTSAREEDGTLVVQALRAASGEPLWSKTFESAAHPKHKFNTYASSTPAADAEKIYLTTASPKRYLVVALDQRDGQERWQRDLGPFVSQHGFGASPIVFEDLLIVPNDQDGPSSVVALDRASGNIRWQAPRKTGNGSAAFATPCIYQPEGGKPQLILSSWSHGLSGLDPRSGKLIWELPVFQNRVVGSPTVAAGVVFAAAGVGGVGRQMVAVQPGDPDRQIEAKVLYRVEKALPYVVTPVARGSLLFVWNDQGVVTCLDAPTGKVYWVERVGGDYFGSPVRLGDRLYCIARDGKLVTLAASEKSRPPARVDLGERSHSTPAIANGVLYLRTVSHLMAIGPENGR